MREGRDGKLPTAQDAVLREIRQAIMTRKLEPGQWVRQLDLAQRLNVSSVPVREALKTLEAEGQVTYEPYRGYKVVELSVDQLEEIYLARGLLEEEVTRRAVENIDDALVRSLEETLARMEELAEAGDVVGYSEANVEFHFLIFEQVGAPQALPHDRPPVAELRGLSGFDLRPGVVEAGARGSPGDPRGVQGEGRRWGHRGAETAQGQRDGEDHRLPERARDLTG